MLNVESLLSKLAVNERGVERAAYDGDGVCQLHHTSAEVNPYDEILQHLQSIAPAFSANGVSNSRGRHAGRTARSRLHLLGPIRRDAVCPTGARAFAARNLRRLGQLRGQAGASRGGGPQPLDARVRQCASAVDALSNGVLPGPGSVSRGRRLEAIPLQE